MQPKSLINEKSIFGVILEITPTFLLKSELFERFFEQNPTKNSFGKQNSGVALQQIWHEVLTYFVSWENLEPTFQQHKNASLLLKNLTFILIRGVSFPFFQAQDETLILTFFILANCVLTSHIFGLFVSFLHKHTFDIIGIDQINDFNISSFQVWLWIEKYFWKQMFHG